MLKKWKVRFWRRMDRRARLCRRFERLRIEALTGASLGDYLQFPRAYDDMVRAMRHGRGLHRDDWSDCWVVLR